jgi:hypothetical protein
MVVPEIIKNKYMVEYQENNLCFPVKDMVGGEGGQHLTRGGSASKYQEKKLCDANVVKAV